MGDAAPATPWSLRDLARHPRTRCLLWGHCRPKREPRPHEALAVAQHLEAGAQCAVKRWIHDQRSAVKRWIHDQAVFGRFG